MGVCEVVVGDPAITVDAPVGGPRVTDEEFMGLVVAPDGHHGVAADMNLTPHR